MRVVLGLGDRVGGRKRGGVDRRYIYENLGIAIRNNEAIITHGIF